MNDARAGGVVTHEHFADRMRELADAFGDMEQAVVDSKDRVLRELDDAMRSVASATSSRGPALRDSPLTALLHESGKTIAQVVAEWQARVDRFELNTAFRADFGDSLLLLVHGLVKAGKSSLGNFVAYGHHDPDEARIAVPRNAGQAPDYFVRTLAGGEDPAEANDALARAGKFAVDAEEATSAIQGFRLGGLTWIDSPGLGSVTEANGALAREYTEAADLILILMNMSQAGRRPEFEALTDLLRRGKPVMVLLTRADEIETDEVNGRLVRQLIMKSDQARAETADWVGQQLAEILRREGGEVLDHEMRFVSVRYAEEYPSAEGLERSGLASLFSRLLQVAADDGVAMKRKAPARNLIAFIDAVLAEPATGGVTGILGQLGKLRQEADSAAECLRQRGRLATEEAKQEIMAMVEAAILPSPKEGDDDQASRLKAECEEKAHKIVSRQIEKLVRETITDVEHALAKSIELDVPRDRYVFEDVTRTVSYQAVARARATGSAIGLTVGALIGFLVGGPPGAFLGASIGGTGGGLAGGAFAGEREEEVVVGDNRDEVAERIVSTLGREAERQIDQCAEDLLNGCLVPVGRQASVVGNRLEQFEQSLRSIQRSLGEAA